MTESDKTQAILRDGTILAIGDEVETDYHPSCLGRIFVVYEINPWELCESGSMVVVHLQGHPERKILGFKKEGLHLLGPDGIDANWFKKIIK